MTLVRKRSQIRSCRSLTPEIEFLSCLLLFPVLRYDEGFHHIINIDTSPVVITQMMERNMDRRRIGTDPYLFGATWRGRVVRTFIEVLFRVDRPYAAPVNMATIFPCLYSEIFTIYNMCRILFINTERRELRVSPSRFVIWHLRSVNLLSYISQYRRKTNGRTSLVNSIRVLFESDLSYRQIKGLSNFGTPDMMDSSNEQWTSRLNGPENSTEIVNILGYYLSHTKEAGNFVHLGEQIKWEPMQESIKIVWNHPECPPHIWLAINSMTICQNTHDFSIHDSPLFI